MRYGRWDQVQSVSFPRSGHEYISELTEAYFGPEFIYRNEFVTPFPSGIHFLKGHDFDLKLPIEPGLKYLVQVRDPFESIYSWHKMSVHRDGSPDTPQAFRNFFDATLDYWVKFVRKWVVPTMENRLIVHYADLVENPKEVMYSIVKFFGEAPSEAKIRSVLHQCKPKERRWPARLCQ